MTTVLAFSGSTRAASFHTRIIRALPALAPEGLRIVEFDLTDVPFYNEDLEGDRQPHSVIALRAAVAEADGVIFAAPEYNGSYSALTKNTIDWLTRPFLQGVLARKKVMLVCVTPGPGGGRKISQIIAELLPLFGNEVISVVTSSGVGDKISREGDTDSITDAELAAALRDGLASF